MALLNDLAAFRLFCQLTLLLLPNSYQGKVPLQLGFGALVIWPGGETSTSPDIFHVSAGETVAVQTVARQAVRLDGRTPAAVVITGV